MREMHWPEAEPLSGVLIDTDALHVSSAPMGGAALISGDLTAAVATLAPEAPMLGLGGECGAAPWGARIGRDRALLALPDTCTAQNGWHEGGFAITPADDLWAVVTITGRAADRIIAEGTSIDPDGGSRSAAVLFAGLNCLLLRVKDGYAICVQTPLVWYLCEWLKAVARDGEE